MHIVIVVDNTVLLIYSSVVFFMEVHCCHTRKADTVFSTQIYSCVVKCSCLNKYLDTLENHRYSCDYLCDRISRVVNITIFIPKPIVRTAPPSCGKSSKVQQSDARPFPVTWSIQFYSVFINFLEPWSKLYMCACVFVGSYLCCKMTHQLCRPNKKEPLCDSITYFNFSVFFV